jgi:hypothetical protein
MSREDEHFWQVQGFPVQFTHRGKVYNGIVLSYNDNLYARNEAGYELCKVEVTETTEHSYVDWNNVEQCRTSTKTYIWPEPIQSYKLRKRHVESEAH